MRDKIKILRTPEERFEGLPDYPFSSHYVEIEGIRIHYVDEGPEDGIPILMLHGEPTWSFLYRKIIKDVAEAGGRAIVPDLVGFGKSDKPAERSFYTYRKHIMWVRGFIKAIKLKNAILLCHDWGGLIGLRIAAEEPDTFRSIIACNTFLPTGDIPPGESFMKWRRFSQEVPEFDVGWIVNRGCVKELPAEVIRAYNAPFPDEEYKEGARQFPVLVPISPNDPEAEPNRKAWEVLSKWEKPFITAFSDSDPITRGGDKLFQMAIPGARGQPHRVIKNAGHYLQEDNPQQLSEVVINHLEECKRRKL